MWDQNKEKLGVTGHRGCKAYMPENTLISFREAFRLGVDVLEFDIQLTRDDVMIVMHDEMVDRTTDGTGAVWFKTLEEMKALDAGVKFGFPGERVPTFEEALECIRDEAPAHMVLNVEIKEQRPRVADVAIELLEKYGLLERSVIASFDAQTLLYVQDHYPHVKTQGQPPVKMKRYDPRVLDRMYGMGVPMSMSDEDIEALVKMLDEKGIEAWGYHADTREAAERCMKFEFTNITANDPHDLIAYLDEIGRRVYK
ncbi:MAG: glycerophosphodiester phosphodiesterase [Clostridia bacterium]|nr:glycerophosphodiester phosphodiesterase [Clostridia bacterium]